MRALAHRFACAATLLLIIVLPWFFGGVRPEHQLGVAALLLVGLLTLVFLPQRAAISWRAARAPAVVLLIACLLGAAQLSPAFGAWSARWNPQPSALRAEFTAVPSSMPGPPSVGPLSLNPVSTKRQTAALICAVAAFALGAALFAETQALMWLLGTLAALGSAVSFFGLVQRLSWNGLIYWTRWAEGGQPFGPFINRNNAGGFLELTLAAAVGLLLWQIASVPAFVPDVAPPMRSRGRRQTSATRRERFAWMLAHLTTPMLATGAAVLLISAGILATFSRGSFVALTVGSAAALLLISALARRATTAWLPVVLIVCGLSLVAWLGQTDALYKRLVTLTNNEAIESEPRVVHWQTSLKAASDFWLLGSGLGTYHFAYARYQEAPTRVTFYYAENQYLDTLLSAGVVGLILFLAAWLLLARSVLRLLREGRAPKDFGIAVTATLLLTSQTLHACFDFAMYVPAHFVTLAVLCGALMARSQLPCWADLPPPKGRGRATAAAALIALLVGVVWSGDQFRRAMICRQMLESTVIFDDRRVARDVAAVDVALDAARRAAEACPDDADVGVRLADLWQERYRRSFRRMLADVAVDPLAWRWEAPTQLASDAHLLFNTRDDTALAALRNNPLVVENLYPALAAARKARSASPLSYAPHFLLGELCFLDEPPSNDAFYLDRAARLAGGRDDRFYQLGVLHLNAGRPKRAFELWRRSWQISSRFERPIIYAAAGFLTPEQMLNQVIPAVPETIVHVAEQFFSQPEQQYNRNVLLRRAAQLLAAVPQPSAEQCRQRGDIEAKLDQWTAAAMWYQRALGLDGTHADWYFEAAEIFIRLDDWDQAAIMSGQAFRLAPEVGKFREQYLRVQAELEKREADDAA